MIKITLWIKVATFPPYRLNDTAKIGHVSNHSSEQFV